MCIEAVRERMMDPVKVGETMALLAIERDRLKQENLRLVVEMDELRQTIQDQAEIIERYEAPL
jgi:hypothetical protein